MKASKKITTKEDLFEVYGINESHSEWNMAIDNWFSVEVYRAMHCGNLPPQDDDSVWWITGFLDKCHEDIKWARSFEKFGSMYLTAKRMIYSLCDEILKDKTK